MVFADKLKSIGLICKINYYRQLMIKHAVGYGSFITYGYLHYIENTHTQHISQASSHSRGSTTIKKQTSYLMVPPHWGTSLGTSPSIMIRSILMSSQSTISSMEMTTKSLFVYILPENYEFMHAQPPQSATMATYKSAAHWVSNYRYNNTKCIETAISQPKRPQWSEIKPAHTSDRMFKETEYHKSFGTFGSNPREKLPSSTTKLVNEENPHM
jgi:hypothetical protein